jgi:hypothetical protein
MTGDLTDIVSRLRAVLPKRWFAERSPNLTAILTSIATPWVWLYGTVNYLIIQTRLSTATDEWLDLIAYDYFGDLLGRHTVEADTSYRSRIKSALLRDAATRSAVVSGLKALTGSRPIIFEPANCMDTGSYGSALMTSAHPGAGLAYGRAGGWGSMDLPFQFFITVVRPPTPGISLLAGYGTPNGGFGAGVISYVDLTALSEYVTDENIQDTLCNLLPVNATAWLRIQ